MTYANVTCYSGVFKARMPFFFFFFFSSLPSSVVPGTSTFLVQTVPLALSLFPSKQTHDT